MTLERRIQIIFKGYEIFDFRDPDVADWIEFNARPKRKTHRLGSAYVKAEHLAALDKLTGGTARATAYDISDAEDGSDSVLYVLIEGVPKKPRRKR
jgi:hypothetical protein